MRAFFLPFFARFRRRLFWLTPLLVALGSIGLGFALTWRGVATWDSLPHLDRSRWLIHELGLPSSRPSDGLIEMLKWYGPLWVLFLGLLSEFVFRSLRDPLWVQQAFNFALYPVGLYVVRRLLGRAGVRRSTSWLAVSLLFSAIRLGGHALVNVNDFPMAWLSLLVMLYLWNKLREADAVARVTGRISHRTLCLLGVVAMVPFLVRPPVLVQFVTLIAVLFVYAFTSFRGASRATRVAVVTIPLGAGGLFAISIWPSLWERGRALPWQTAITGFTRFAWVGNVRYFGHTVLSTRLPWYYPVIWLPVMLTPLAFVVLVLGLARTGFGARPVGNAFPVEIRRRGIDLTLRRWLALHAALFWLAVLLVHPTLYDEERHLLFLYPPLLLLAALGLDDLNESVKWGLTILLAATSLISYGFWGRYSYVYKSLLIGDQSAARFEGDYWGVCVPLAVSALQGRVPPGSEVVVSAPFDAALAEYDRLRQSRLRARPDFGPYRLVTGPARPGDYSIVYNRNGSDVEILRAIRDGRAALLWQTSMPPGDPACLIVRR
jgi:hypothetical protein